MSKMKDKTHNMNSIIKNHKIEDHVMSLESWLWNRNSEEWIPWFSTQRSSMSTALPLTILQHSILAGISLKEEPILSLSIFLIMPRKCVTITCCFLSFSSVYLCLLCVSWPVDCLSPINCVSFLISFYLRNPGITCSILKYSSQNLLLYY